MEFVDVTLRSLTGTPVSGRAAGCSKEWRRLPAGGFLRSGDDHPPPDKGHDQKCQSKDRHSGDEGGHDVRTAERECVRRAAAPPERDAVADEMSLPQASGRGGRSGR